MTKGHDIFSLIYFCSSPASQRCNPQTGGEVEWSMEWTLTHGDKNYSAVLQQSDEKFEDVRDCNLALKISTEIFQPTLTWCHLGNKIKKILRVEFLLFTQYECGYSLDSLGKLQTQESARQSSQWAFNEHCG